MIEYYKRNIESGILEYILPFERELQESVCPFTLLNQGFVLILKAYDILYDIIYYTTYIIRYDIWYDVFNIQLLEYVIPPPVVAPCGVVLLQMFHENKETTTNR